MKTVIAKRVDVQECDILNFSTLIPQNKSVGTLKEIRFLSDVIWLNMFRNIGQFVSFAYKIMTKCLYPLGYVCFCFNFHTGYIT